MKTAIELADTIDNGEETTGFERRCAAMLRTQAQENEALKAELRRAKNDLADALDCKNGMGPTALGTVLKERDALKADAERYKAVLSVAYVGIAHHPKPHEVWCLRLPNPTGCNTLDAAIDAMKGKS